MHSLCRGLVIRVARVALFFLPIASIPTLAIAQPGHGAHVPAAGGLPHGIPDFCGNSSIASAANGAWSNPSTWSPARVPVSGDRVSISHTVTYDVQSSAPLACVEVLGQLAFRADVSTLLTVGTLMVYPNAALKIGTPSGPIAPAVTAQIVIADRPLDTTFDPEQFGTGIIGLGTITISGSSRTPFTRLASEAGVNSSTLAAAQPLTGWRSGDKVFLPDTRHLTDAQRTNYAPQWEERIASSVGSTSLTVAAPLQFLHEGARDGSGALTFLPHVGNLSRNVIIRSANPAGTRGHMLFAVRANVDIRYALIKDMGRTTTAPLDSTTFDAAGVVTHVGTNQIGRYPLHLHHVMGPTSPPPSGYQFQLIGNAVDGGRKWGIAIHNSHYGLVQSNVVYDVAGAGIVTEDGSETNNVIEKNFVARIGGVWGRADSRGTADLAWEGAGIWLRGMNNYVRDNVAANAPLDFGFKYFPYYIGSVRIPNFPGADTTMAGQFTLQNGNAIPIKEFVGNEAYGATPGGFSYWWLGTQDNSPVANATWSVVKDLKVWHAWDKAVYDYPANMLTLDGLIVRGKSANANEFSVGFYAGDYMAKHLLIVNADIQGMTYGIIPSTNSGGGVQVIRNSYLRNVVNISLQTPYTSGAEARAIPPRKVVIRNVRFDTVPSPWPTVAARDLEFKYAAIPVRNLVQRDNVYVYEADGVASDNYRAFYAEQRPNFVMPQTVVSQWNTHWVEGAPVAGLTNQQTWNTYGLAIAGSVAPCANALPGNDGFACSIPWADPITDGLPSGTSGPRPATNVTVRK